MPDGTQEPAPAGGAAVVPAPAHAPRTPLRGGTPVRDLLGSWGPEGESLGMASVLPDQALAYCRELTTSHYENFSVLTSLVPPELRDHFAAVYAFCRWSDDLGDEYGDGPLDEARREATRRLAWWRGELDRCWEGEATHPVFVALMRTREVFADLPRQPFADLIGAFEQDQRVSRYQDWDGVVDYCTRSANPVGRIVLHLGGYPDTPENAERYAASDAVCTALQLTNFWQDVRRDLLERDRVYLPQAETGLRDEHLRAWLDRGHEPGVRQAYIRAIRPLVDRTWSLFDAGRSLDGLLDRRIGPVVWLLGAGGRAVLGRVEAVGCATLWRRPTLSKRARAVLLARAWARRAGIVRAGGASAERNGR